MIPKVLLLALIFWFQPNLSGITIWGVMELLSGAFMSQSTLVVFAVAAMVVGITDAMVISSTIITIDLLVGIVIGYLLNTSNTTNHIFIDYYIICCLMIK